MAGSTICPLSPPTLPPDESQPDLGRGRGPSHARCRVGPAPLQAPIRHPDKKLKSSTSRGESDAKKLRPVVFHAVQSRRGLGPGSV